MHDETQRGLIGDRLTSLLPPDAPGSLCWRIVALRETASTNDVAAQLAQAGAPEGTVVIADAQTRGRGRLGRAWHSAPGSGLWCSIILRPRVTLAELGPLPLALAVATRRAAAAHGAAGVETKWPNDLMCGGRKLAGILTESRGSQHGSALPGFVIAGIGVNITTPEGGFPDELAQAAVALNQCTPQPPDCARFALTLLQKVSEVYPIFLTEGFAPLRAEWLAHALWLGREIRVVAGPASELSGRFATVNDGGELVLSLADDKSVIIAAGDVTLRLVVD